MINKKDMPTSQQAQQMALFASPDGCGGDATENGSYRYLLTRWWGADPQTLLWILLIQVWRMEAAQILPYAAVL